MKNQTMLAKLCAIGLLSACCYIGFMVIKINIPTPAGSTAIHFGNTFCVLGALLLGGVEGGLAGAIGMGLADLMDPLYVASAPKTIVLKLMIGIIVGLIAHRFAHIKEHSDDRRYSLKWAFLASLGGMAFNVIMDPLIGFLYKNYILNVPYEAAKILAAWSSVSTLINAITSIILATVLYLALIKHVKHLSFFQSSYRQHQ